MIPTDEKIKQLEAEIEDIESKVDFIDRHEIANRKKMIAGHQRKIKWFQQKNSRLKKALDKKRKQIAELHGVLELELGEDQA